MRLPSRRTFWLRAATLLVAIVVCGWFLVPRSRVTQENLDLITDEMSRDEVLRILGEPSGSIANGQVAGVKGKNVLWAYVCSPGNRVIRSEQLTAFVYEDGPNSIRVYFCDGKVHAKAGEFATAWQTVQWHAKNVAAKVGIAW